MLFKRHYVIIAITEDHSNRVFGIVILHFSVLQRIPIQP